MKCWRDHCEHKLEYICACTDPPAYLCDSHIVEHLKIHSKFEQLPEPLTITPNPETKITLISHLHKKISNLYESRIKTVKDLSAQIKQLNYEMEITLKSFDKAIKGLRQMISKVISTEIISNQNKTELDEILVSAPLEISEKLKIIDASNLLIEENNPKENSNQIVLFREFSQKIVRINLSNFSPTEFSLQMDSPKSMHIAMCLMPENSIFCYGNYPTFTDSAFIIGPHNTIREVKNAPHKISCPGLIYYKNCVYILGGWNGSFASNVFKYDTLVQKWENLESLPIPSSHISCIARKNKILLSGREHSKIYCYDIIEQICIELYNMEPGTFRKIVCENDTNAYVIETGRNVYESNHEWKSWSIIASSLSIENNELIGYKVIWQNKVYFTSRKFELYEFDMKEKTTKMIKTV